MGYIKIYKIAGDLASCLDIRSLEPLDIELSELPEGIKEGDVLIYDFNGYAVRQERKNGRVS